MTFSSRFPGFYKLSIEERRRIMAEALGVDVTVVASAVSSGGLDATGADKTIENVIGVFALPFAFGLNVHINGRDMLAPMVVEEPSVVAAASNAARIIRQGGGFFAEADAPVMIAQVQLDDVPDAQRAASAVLDNKAALLAHAAAAVPGLVARGGGPVNLQVRDLGDGLLVVHVLVDCRDAMGANLVNSVAEAVSPHVQALTGGTLGLRILSNLCDQRCVRVRVRVPAEALAFESYSGEQVRDGIVRASRFAERDPYRAATHNKGVMNGIDAVTVATGNDWRAVEAGVHAFAARNGRYAPVCTWSVDSEGALIGAFEAPLALGIVGGAARTHVAARFALQSANLSSAQELAMLAASVGVASNFAALRALATDGIQRGHMLLHARIVAAAAGATGDMVEIVAAEIHEAGDVTFEAARTTLLRLRPDLFESAEQSGDT